jgi:hypothetical protein
MGGWIRLWWEDAGEEVSVEPKKENARLGLGEMQGEGEGEEKVREQRKVDGLDKVEVEVKDVTTISWKMRKEGRQGSYSLFLLNRFVWGISRGSDPVFTTTLYCRSFELYCFFYLYCIFLLLEFLFFFYAPRLLLLLRSRFRVHTNTSSEVKRRWW